MAYNHNHDFNVLKLAYPNLYNSMKKLYDFDKKVERYIDKRYGKDTIENIIKFNEYNNEKYNVNRKILSNTIFNKIAQSHQLYYNTFISQSTKVKNVLGIDNTHNIIKLFRQELYGTKSHDTSFMDGILNSLG